MSNGEKAEGILAQVDGRQVLKPNTVGYMIARSAVEKALDVALAKPVAASEQNKELDSLLGAYRNARPGPTAKEAKQKVLDYFAAVKPVAAALPASNEQAKQADTELRGMLMRAIEWANEFGNGSIATTVIAGALVSTGRRLAATPALPAEKVQGLTELQKYQIVAGCATDDLEQIHVALGFPEDRPIDAEDMIEAIRELKDATGTVPAPALPVVPEGLAALKEMVRWFGSYPEFVPSPAHMDSVSQSISKAKAIIAAAPELPEGNQQPPTPA